MTLHVVGVIVVLSVVVFAMAVFGARRAVQRLSGEVTHQATERTREGLNRFFEPVGESLGIAARWSQAGRIAPEAPLETLAVLGPLVRQSPSISSAIIADEAGHEVLILELDDGWRVRITEPPPPDGAAESTNTIVLLDRQGRETRRWREHGYTPLDRAWFRLAMERADEDGFDAQGRGSLAWTDVYTFFTTGDYGITAAMPHLTADGSRRVIAFDVLLRDISEFTRGIHVVNDGVVVVTTPQRRLIGAPGLSEFDDAERLRGALERPLGDLEIPLLARADETLGALYSSDEFRVLRFGVGGEPWWGAADLYRLGGERSYWIWVLVPERDILGDLHWQRVLIPIAAGIALCLGVLRALQLAARYSGPLRRLVDQSDRISRMELDEGEPITSTVEEVQQLARAQDHMRASLRTLVKLEQDMALARRIQQDTWPAAMPTDDRFEIDAWSEPADETGGDGYDVVPVRIIDGEREPCDDHPDRVFCMLADATGHGVGPALSVAQARSMFRMAVRAGMPLDDIARHANQQLGADLTEGRFITAWMAEFDPATGELSMVSAGQAPLYLLRSGGGIERFGASVPPMGVLPDLPDMEPVVVPLGPGDAFVVCSDGIYEAMDEDHRQLGEDAAIRAITEAQPGGLGAMRAAIAATVGGFAGSAPASDDRTCLLIRRVR